MQTKIITSGDYNLFIIGDQLRDYSQDEPNFEEDEYRYVTREDLMELVRKIRNSPSCMPAYINTYGMDGSRDGEEFAVYLYEYANDPGESYLKIGCKHISADDEQNSLKILLEWVTGAATPEKLIAAFRNVANEDDHHGHFLGYFAKAICQADLENQRLLLPAMRQLNEKYNIIKNQEARGILKPEQYQTTAA